MRQLMEMLDILPNLKEKSLTTEKKLVLHPNGKIDYETQEMKDLELLVKEHIRDKILHEGRKLKKKIEDFRIKKSINEYNTLVNYIDDIKVAIMVEKGRNKIYSGLLDIDDSGAVRFKHPKGLSDSAKGILDDGTKFYKFINSAHLKAFFCPPQFFYDKEYFDKKSLELFLDVENYTNNDSVKSKYVKLKSNDDKNKVNIGLYLNKEKILLQYIALGYKSESKRSKLHIVTSFDYSGRFNGIYHLEQLILEPEELKTMKFEENAASYVKTGVPSNEFIRNLLNYKTSEFKTDMKTGEVFFLNEASDGKKYRIGNKDISKYFPHYELLFKRPALLGGPFFEYVSNFISENAKELEKLRKNIQKNST